MLYQQEKAELPSKNDRLILFVGGYDPRGARHYHQMMQRESLKQGEVSQESYKVGSRHRWGPGLKEGLLHSQWTVSNDRGKSSDYVFVDWSDLVRQSWASRIADVVWQGLKTYCLIFRNKNVLSPLLKATPYAIWTLVYPLVCMLLCLALACIAITVSYKINPGWVGFANGILIGFIFLWAGYALDKKIHVSWLLRILNFSRKEAENSVHEVDDRFKRTAKIVARQIISSDYQELVVIGFSVGSAVAVSFAQSIREEFILEGCPKQKINLLTLGNCIPLFSLMPGADRIRSNLFELAKDESSYWVDISSPSDSVSFGMCDLLALSFPKQDSKVLAGCVNPRHMCTPRFHKLFTPSAYRWMKRNKMRMHFQYLMASDLSGAYDYFKLLTCKESLPDFIEKRLVR